MHHWSKEIKEETSLAARKAADRERRAQSEERGKAERSRLQEVFHRRRVEKFVSESDNWKLQMEKARSCKLKLIGCEAGTENSSAAETASSGKIIRFRLRSALDACTQTMHWLNISVADQDGGISELDGRCNLLATVVFRKM